MFKFLALFLVSLKARFAQEKPAAQAMFAGFQSTRRGLSRRWDEIKFAWSIRGEVAGKLLPGTGAETGNLAGLIVGVILAIVAAVVGINMLPSVITAWVTVSNTTGLDSSAASLTDVGQIVAVVVGIIVAVAVILVVLRISEHAT